MSATSATSPLTPDTFKPLLAKLVFSPSSFSASDIQLALAHILVPDALLPAQAGAFVTALHFTAVDRRADILAAASSTLLDRAVVPVIEGAGEDFIVDIVGTGGDGHNTFNVSTTAAFVAAGAGARVCKHGARASTSSSGSADLLGALGCQFPTPPSSPSNSLYIPRTPFTFLLAPLFHPALALIAATRRSLPFRTLFNAIGPLSNPARPRGIVLGVAIPEMGRVFAEALCAPTSGVERAFVVCGEEKLDEVSCAGGSYVWEISSEKEGGKEGKTIKEFKIHPTEDFGLPTHTLEEVASGTPAENAETFKALLCPESFSHQDENPKLTPIRNFVLLNAATLLVVSGTASDFRDGVAKAKKSISSGGAWDAFVKFRDAKLSVAS